MDDLVALITITLLYMKIKFKEY